MSSGSPSQIVQLVGGPGARGQGAARPAGRGACPADRGKPRRAPRAPRTRARAAATENSSSANGSSPSASPCCSTNASADAPTRRSARSQPPRRSPRRRECRARRRATPPCPDSRAITNVSASASLTIPRVDLHGGRGTLPVFPAPVAQGIERAPPEREVAGSNPPGRTGSLRHSGRIPGQLRPGGSHVQTHASPAEPGSRDLDGRARPRPRRTAVAARPAGTTTRRPTRSSSRSSLRRSASRRRRPRMPSSASPT